MNTKYKTGDLIDVEIKKIVPKGSGLAFAEGLTVFTPLTVAGDEVRVRLSQVKGKTAFAEVEKILRPAADRIDPPCKYFGRCGGCDMQQMNYSAQRAAKAGMVEDSLKRIGRIQLQQPIEVAASPAEFGYRSRAQWQIDAKRQQIGYFRRHSHDVIDIEHCPVLVPELDEKLKELRRGSNWGEFWDGKGRIEAAAAGGEVSLYSPELIEPTAELVCQAAGVDFRYSARSFFQGNQFLLEPLIEAAVGGLEGEMALDLYCGVGLFSLPLAKTGRAVHGIEANEEAIELARGNAASNALPNAEFSTAGVGDFLAEYDGPADAIVLDPPRSGTEEGVIERIIDIAPAAISYVSCDPAILARDLRKLLDGGYAIEFIKGFDLFPQTHHVETVVRLRRIENGKRT